MHVWLTPVEQSAQKIPITTEITEPASSRPLHELEELAPAFEQYIYFASHVQYPFANDNSAAVFGQLRARTMTAEYQKATNRTALLVGESALAAALPYLPEETIVVVDANPSFCKYMRHYIDSLRGCDNLADWHAEMTDYDKPGYATAATTHPDTDLTHNARGWNKAGLPHALKDEAAYKLSHELANEKAIIPWYANLKGKKDMQRLGFALSSLSAVITMANLSNAMEYADNKPNNRRLQIDCLPFSADAPILTSSALAIPDEFDDFSHPYLQLTGPFFGLDELRANGGFETMSGGWYRWAAGLPVIQRRYLNFQPESAAI